MEKIAVARLQRLIAKPLEFWPFHAHISSDERAVRAARGCLYLGTALSIRASSLHAGMWFMVAAVLLLLLFGKPSGIHLDDASLAGHPNAAGNALTGDMSGRSPDIPQTESSLSMTQFVDRMQNPLRVDDYAIVPVASPTEAHTVFNGSEDPTVTRKQTGPLAYVPR